MPFTNIIPGYRPICDECKDKKQPLIVTSNKSNPKRVINQFKKKVQKKRRVVSSKQVVSSDDEEEWNSDEETLTDLSDDDLPIARFQKLSYDSSSSDSSDNKPIARLKNEDSTDVETAIDLDLQSQRNENESVRILPSKPSTRRPRRKVNEHVFTMADKLASHLGLIKIRTPPIGDCLPQSCILALCNRQMH